MNLSELKYIEFTGKHITIAAAGVAIVLMSAGLFTAFFTNLIFIIACIGGVGIAGKIAFDNYQNQKRTFNEPAAPARPIRPDIKPVIINLVENSGAIPDPTTLLKYMGIDKLQEPALNNPGCADQAGQMQQTNLTALDVAIDAERAFVVGGTRSGKTYFCKQLAALRIKNGDMIFAIDPKDQTIKDPWPDGVVIIGEADNFEAIEQFWQWLESEKQERGRDMDNIESYPQIII
jgi:hypothetical protein